MTETTGEALADAEATKLTASDRSLVDTAIKRTSKGASLEELDKLPMPADAPFTAADYALKFSPSWINPSASMQQNSNAGAAVQMLASGGGDLYYSEWACETGQERVVAAQVIGLLPRVVTRYMERMLLRNFILARNMWGYDSVRRCNRGELAIARQFFEKFYVDVSMLAIAGSAQR